MRVAFAAAIALAATPAAAQRDAVVQTRLYVSDPAACEAIEANGVDGIGEATTLSFKDGIQSFEFHCNFFDVKTRDSGPLVLVEAICEEPGIRFPDLISISPYEEDTIEVVSLHDSSTFEATEDNPNPGVSYYTRCDNLSGLPRQ